MRHNLQRFWKLLVAACAAAALGWLALLPPRRGDANTPQPATPGERSEQTSAPPTATPSHPTPPTATPPDPGLRANTAQALASTNAGDRIDALRAVSAAGAVELLPDLLALDPATDPELAPTLISAVRELAARGDPALRATAAARCASWLQSELQRDAPDALANRSLLVEALGQLDTRESVDALSHALASNQLAIHVATLAAEGLARLGDASARPVLEQFRARLAQEAAADSFERELHAEALAATDRALAQWAP